MICVLALVLIVASGCSASNPTKGSIPDDAVAADGSLQFDELPRYVGVSDDTGRMVGYVDKHVMFGPGRTEAVPVLGEDLVTRVGWWVDGSGYIPLSRDPRTAPMTPTTTIN